MTKKFEENENQHKKYSNNNDDIIIIICSVFKEGKGDHETLIMDLLIMLSLGLIYFDTETTIDFSFISSLTGRAPS